MTPIFVTFKIVDNTVNNSNRIVCETLTTTSGAAAVWGAAVASCSCHNVCGDPLSTLDVQQHMRALQQFVVAFYGSPPIPVPRHSYHFPDPQKTRRLDATRRHTNQASALMPNNEISKASLFGHRIRPQGESHTDVVVVFFFLFSSWFSLNVI